MDGKVQSKLYLNCNELNKFGLANGSLMSYSITDTCIKSLVNLPDAVIPTHSNPKQCPVCNSPTIIDSDRCTCTGGLNCLPQHAQFIW